MQAKYLGMPPPRETSWEKGKFPLHFCPPWQLEGDRRTASPSLWGGWRERRGGRLGVKFLMGWGGGGARAAAGVAEGAGQAKPASFQGVEKEPNPGGPLYGWACKMHSLSFPFLNGP